MRLVNNWRKAYKMISVQAMAIAGSLQGAWMVLPTEMRNTIPTNVVQWLTIALLVFGMCGRLVVQPETKV